jgi:hypothetical protein
VLRWQGAIAGAGVEILSDEGDGCGCKQPTVDSLAEQCTVAECAGRQDVRQGMPSEARMDAAWVRLVGDVRYRGARK